MLQVILPVSSDTTWVSVYPLSATLFGIFIDGLHHYLEAAVPTAVIQILQMWLRELVYADDICLSASSPEQLQALINA